MISARLDAMLTHEVHLGSPDHVDALHRMRIAAKQLRYTMEIFRPLYSGAGQAQFDEALEEIKTLQDSLGEIHDADVLTPQLARHLAGLLHEGYGVDRHGVPVAGVHLVDYRACAGLLTLCEETRDERDRIYRALLTDWKRLQDQRTFARLRELLESAVLTENGEQRAPAGATSGKAVPRPPHPKSTPVTEEADEQRNRAETADVRPSVVARTGRRRAASSTVNSAENSGGYSGNGSNPGPSPAEGGL
jgi:hypothetical protein